MLVVSRFAVISWFVAITIAGVGLLHRIRKGQFALHRLRLKEQAAPAIRNAVLAA
jgi:hypothetical protein